MRQITKLLILILSILITGCAHTKSSWPDVDPPVIQNQPEKQPKFFIETINVQSSDKYKDAGTLMVEINIPATELVFKKTDDGGWQADFSIEAQLMIGNVQKSYKYFSDKTDIYYNYSETKNPLTMTMFLITYTGTPNHYTLNLKVSNGSGGKTSFVSMPVIIRKMNYERLDISDPIFVYKNYGKNSLNDFSNKILYLTDVSCVNAQNLNPWKPVNFIFEIYYPEKIRQLLLNKKVIVEYMLTFKDNTIFKEKQKFTFTKIIGHKQIIGIQFSLPNNVNNGNYNFILRVYPEYGSGSYIITKPIRFYSLIPKTGLEIEQAIGPMYYMAPPPHKILKKIKKAETNKEKSEIFYRFWQKKGQDAAEEFYKRVAHANENFKGWRTDPGKVFIRFGSPNDMELFHNYNNNQSQLMIWHYYDLDAGNASSYFNYKIFVFIDEFGFGHYTFTSDLNNIIEFAHY